MRLSKRILSLCMGAILSCTPLFASAESVINDILPDSQNAIVVSGTLDGETRFDATLIFKMTNSDGAIVAVGSTKTKLDEQGNVVFGFDSIKLPLGLASDIYTVAVLGEGIVTPLTTTFEYNGSDRKLIVLKAISQAQTVGSIITGTTSGKANSEILGYDATLYTSLDEVGKPVFEAKMGEVVYNLPANVDNAVNIAKIQAESEKFVEKYEEAVAVAKFAMANTTEEISEWYDNYYTEYGFDEDAEITKVLNEVKTTADFVSRISKKTESMTIPEIKEYMYESALLAGITELSDSKVKDIILNFPTYFPVDTDAYNKLSSANQGYVIGQVSGISYTNCIAAALAVDEQVEKLLHKKVSGSDSSGGGRKPSGGSFPIMPGTSGTSGKENKPEDKLEDKALLKDLSEAKWAEEAIHFLYNRGVVSGDPDGSFRPNNNITRAEVVKLIVTAMNLPLSSGEIPFDDVNADSWYAPYIAAVYKQGIAEGNGYRKFNPEANITRQDLVTMLYRAIDVKSGEEAKTSAFTDGRSISDYAATAVGYFAGKKIVNGFEDGSFGPLKNATRAEAAMIFYKLITTEL